MYTLTPVPVMETTSKLQHLCNLVKEKYTVFCHGIFLETCVSLQNELVWTKEARIGIQE